MEMTIRLAFWEAAPIIVYLLGLLIVGFRESNRIDNETEFILGGRTLTLPAFVATLVTTWYGGDTRGW